MKFCDGSSGTPFPPFYPVLGNGGVFLLALKIKNVRIPSLKVAPAPNPAGEGHRTCHLFISTASPNIHLVPSLSPPYYLQMTRGRPLSQDLRWSLLKMARVHDIKTISNLTGVGKRTVERLMSDYRKYGTAARWGPGRSLRGQKSTSSAKSRTQNPV
jgi:hypothetical protein